MKDKHLTEIILIVLNSGKMRQRRRNEKKQFLLKMIYDFF